MLAQTNSYHGGYVDSGPSEREVPCVVGEYLLRDSSGIIVHAAECVRHRPRPCDTSIGTSVAGCLGDKDNSSAADVALKFYEHLTSTFSFY